MVDLSNMAVDCIRLPRWRWSPGMRVLHVATPCRVFSVEEDEFLGEGLHILKAYQEWDPNRGLCTIITDRETFPDLADPATGGMMLQMLGDGANGVYHTNGKWSLVGIPHSYESLGEACAHLALVRGTWG